jgi:hypothetical protein
MREIVVARGDLIIEGEIPSVVLDFCAHVTAYDALLADWENAGRRDSTLIRHPGSAFLAYLRESYATLRAEREMFLRDAGASR